MTQLRSEDEIIRCWSGSIEEPKVSILCPTFNHGEYIHQALEGFLLQETKFPFQIVVHDDASSDNTAKVIRDYASRYPKIIKPIIQKENLVSRGISRTPYVEPLLTGKFIALCEGDDYWIDPKKLQKQVDFMEKDPSISMSFHPANVIFTGLSGKTSVRNVFPHETSFSLDYALIYGGGFYPTASSLLKNEAYKFYLDLEVRPAAGDTAIPVLAGKIGRIVYFDEVMSVYRHHKGGATKAVLNRSQRKRFKHRHRQFKKDLRFIDWLYSEKAISSTTRNKARDQRHAIIISEALKYRQFFFAKCLWLKFGHHFDTMTNFRLLAKFILSSLKIRWGNYN